MAKKDRFADLEPVDRAYELALNRLDYSARSRAQLEKYLREHDCAAADIEIALDRLESAGLINDLEYAAAIVEEKISAGKASKRALQADLYKRGIDRDIIEQVTADIDTESEYASALYLAKAKMSALTGLDRQVVRRRLYGLLARRGFTYEVCSRVLNELEQESHLSN